MVSLQKKKENEDMHGKSVKYFCSDAKKSNTFVKRNFCSEQKELNGIRLQIC